MLFANAKLEQAFEFVRESDADVICLQEVPESFLGRLRELPRALAYRSDMVKLFRNGAVPSYNIILSRYEIVNRGEVPFPDYWPLLPLRARLFTYLMRPFKFTKLRDRGGLFTDLATEHGTVRVFNLHLMLAHPAWRAEEFETAMLERDPALPTVVCGDFNILESPKSSLLNWILGGRLTDALFWKRERSRMERRFVEHELANPLAGTATHPISRSQLDHILLSPALLVRDARVLPERYGSDHHPIYAEVSAERAYV
jgi:endonuclease/exonuclease/phosphatase family metal-dependent hydrolase